MASNKRNGPTSLFELINKSDLKAAAKGPNVIKSGETADNFSAPHDNKTAGRLSGLGSLVRPPAAAAAGVENKENSVEAATPPGIKSGETISPARHSRDPSAMNHASETWNPRSSSPMTLGGIPLHLVFIGSGVLLALLILILLLLPGHAKSVGTNVRAIPISAPTSADTPRLVSTAPPNDHGMGAPTWGKASHGIGRVWPAAQVQRDPDKWYLVILTSLPADARRAAAFIAHRGVSVSVEPARNGWATVISVQGFKDRANLGAIAFRRKVVRLGLAWPGASRTHHSPWNDAYFARVRRYP